MKRLSVHDREIALSVACTSGTSQVPRVASLQRLKMEALIPTSADVKCGIYNKVSECTEHSTDRNTLSAVPGLWPHTARRATHLLQEFGWEVFNHVPYSPDLAPSDFYLFLHLKKFLSGQPQRFQNDREAEMSINEVPISGGRLLLHMIHNLVPLYDKCLNPGGEYVE